MKTFMLSLVFLLVSVNAFAIDLTVHVYSDSDAETFDWRLFKWSINGSIMVDSVEEGSGNISKPLVFAVDQGNYNLAILVETRKYSESFRLRNDTKISFFDPPIFDFTNDGVLGLKDVIAALNNVSKNEATLFQVINLLRIISGL